MCDELGIILQQMLLIPDTEFTGTFSDSLKQYYSLELCIRSYHQVNKSIHKLLSLQGSFRMNLVIGETFR